MLSTSSFIRQGLRGSEELSAHRTLLLINRPPLLPLCTELGLMLMSPVAKEMLLLENLKSLLIKSG